MNAQVKSQPDYLVKDLSLAAWGRKEIKIAETEMPGLMADVYKRQAANRSRIGPAPNPRTHAPTRASVRIAR